ncbi:MAG: glutamate 5-kinase [Abditibacteriota bacterium]|nr:glutamate 5-kinase [Abditibacteriota bacterium]MBP5093489.1 glutamate 5-kinase [Abditibacteriota bacterium]MBP5738533.1 glutamate 5-kinase [Abditibacteriota bacterium]
MTKRISGVKRLVVKVGTSSLVDEKGSLCRKKMSVLAKQLADAKKSGVEVVLVSSGAIRAGMETLGMTKRPGTIAEKQGVAAVGQSLLMAVYTSVFGDFGIPVGQVLVTRDDFNDRVRYLNACNTLNTLIRMDCMPIVNENDTVAVSEIKFGDNDTLASLVAAGINADLLILLSDIEGLYDSNPAENPNAKFIEKVTKITPEIEALGGGSLGLNGVGGMKTKLEAAKTIMASGSKMVIADASRENVVTDILAGEYIGTLFAGKQAAMGGKKRWIVFGHRVKGTVTVNAGAEKMIREKGKSLLAIGITDCTGSFKTGDMVSVAGEDGTVFARGLVNYNIDEVKIIKGKHTDEMHELIGYKDFDEVIHRDNLVLVEG